MLKIPSSFVSQLALLVVVSDDKTPKFGTSFDTFTTDDGVTLMSIDGDFDSVTELMGAQDLNPVAIVADGDNAHLLAGKAAKSLLKRHVIAIIDIPDGKTLSEAFTTIDKQALESRFVDTYAYGHFVAAMDNKVMVAAWDKNYGDGKWQRYAFQARLDAYVDPETSTIYGADSGTNVLGLIGRTGKRTTIGMIADQKKTFKVISSDFDDQQLEQIATGELFIEAAVGTNEIHAVNIEQLSAYLNGEHELAWAQTQVDGKVQAISAEIDGTENVILSLTGSTYRYMPAKVVLDDGKLQVVSYAAYGLSYDEMAGDDLGPIVRVSHKTDIVETVDRNGGKNIVRFAPVNSDKSWSPKFTKMIEAASTNQLSA